jgi:hypothetical protein
LSAGHPARWKTAARPPPRLRVFCGRRECATWICEDSGQTCRRTFVGPG